VFECLWREGVIEGEGMRPDKWGVLFAAGAKSDGTELGVYELWELAANHPLVGELIERLRPYCDYVTIYPPRSIAGIHYRLSPDYPNGGEEDYFAPAIPLGDGIKMYFGLFRPRHMMERPTCEAVALILDTAEELRRKCKPQAVAGVALEH